MKIRSVRAELFRGDGRTDKTKLTFAFGYFAKAPNKLSHLYINSLLGCYAMSSGK